MPINIVTLVQYVVQIGLRWFRWVRAHRQHVHLISQLSVRNDRKNRTSHKLGAENCAVRLPVT